MRFWLCAACAFSLLAGEASLVPIAVPGKRAFPPLGRICRVEGSVPLKVTVDETGKPLQVVAVGGPQVLWGAAQAYVSGIRFLPPMVDGRPGTATLPYEMPFSLPKTESASPLPAIEEILVHIRAPRALEGPALENQIRAFLKGLGLPAAGTGKADAWRTLQVDVDIDTFGLGEGANGYTMTLRCSRKVDKGLDPEADLREFRAWYGGRAGAIRGKDLAPALLEAPMAELLSELAGSTTFPTGPYLRERDGIVLIGDNGSKGLNSICRFRELKVRKERFTPAFPTKAFVRRWSGTVDLEMALDAGGTPVAARTLTGPPLFQESAIRNAMALAFDLDTARTVTVVMSFGPGYWEQRTPTQPQGH